MELASEGSFLSHVLIDPIKKQWDDELNITQENCETFNKFFLI